MLAKVLELEKLSDLKFRAHHHMESFRKTLFGGQAIAQALKAAGLTTDGRPVHSLHAYFLSAGVTASPVDYEVTLMRNGRSFLTRQVNAIQDDKVIFTMLASFHTPETGYAHQAPCPPGRKLPEDIKMAMSASSDAHLPETAKNVELKPIELITDNPNIFVEAASEEVLSRFWMKTKDALPDDPLTHSCALAFASDLGLLASSLLPHDTTLFSKNVFPASLDHAIWFHQAVDLSDFVEYVIESPWAGHARGFSRGAIYDRAGTRIASTSQEGLIRPIHSEDKPTES